MGDAEQFGEDDAGLAEAEVVGLEAGEDEVGRLGADGVGEQLRAAASVSREARSSSFDVDGAVGALGERLAQGGGDAFRAGAEDDHLAAVLLLELQRLFEGVGVGLVDGVGEVVFVDPLCRPSAMAIWASRSGTCLMATMIFMTAVRAPALRGNECSFSGLA